MIYNRILNFTHGLTEQCKSIYQQNMKNIQNLQFLFMIVWECRDTPMNIETRSAQSNYPLSMMHVLNFQEAYFGLQVTNIDKFFELWTLVC
jgi:hypothetical protein